MDYVVLDTDIASLSFRRRLPTAVMALAGTPVLSGTLRGRSATHRQSFLRNFLKPVHGCDEEVTT